MSNEPHPEERPRRTHDDAGRTEQHGADARARTRLRRGLFGYRGRDVEHLLRRLGDLYTALARTQERERVLATELADLDAGLVDARKELALATADLAAANAELSVLDDELAAATRELVAARQTVAVTTDELAVSRRRKEEHDDLASRRAARGHAGAGGPRPLTQPHPDPAPDAAGSVDRDLEAAGPAAQPGAATVPAPGTGVTAARFRVTPLADYADLARFVRDLSAHEQVESVVVDSFDGDIAELTARLTGPSTIEQVVQEVEQEEPPSMS